MASPDFSSALSAVELSLRTASLNVSPPRIRMYCSRAATMACVAGLAAAPPGIQMEYVAAVSVVNSMPRVPPGSSDADMTTAPAPSPKRTHVLRSVKSVQRLIVSAPMTRACLPSPLAR